MKKKRVSFVAKVMLLLLVASAFLSTNSFGYNTNNVVEAAPPPGENEERIVLGSYTLSKTETKDLANNMKTIKSNSNLKTLIYGVALKWGGVYGWAGTIATQLSTSSTYKQEVIDAAKAGKRLKVTVTDSKYNHTSYSTRVNYTIVK